MKYSVDFPHRQREPGIDERRVDVLARAGSSMRWCSAARMPIEREQARAEIGQRHAGLDRRAAGDRR